MFFKKGDRTAWLVVTVALSFGVGFMYINASSGISLFPMIVSGYPTSQGLGTKTGSFRVFLVPVQSST